MSQAGTYISGMGPSGPVTTLTGNTGGAVSPTGGNINVEGSGNITFTGNPGLSTTTATLVGTTNHAVQIGNSSGSLTSISVGTTGQVLTGVTGSDPIFSSPAPSIITITGDSGGGLVGNSFTFTGGTTGLTFSGAGTTETLIGTLAIANGGTNATSFATTDGTVYYNGTRLVTTATGTTGQVLTSNGTGVAPSYQTFSVLPVAYTNVNATPYIVLATDYYLSVDASGGAITVQLPNAPTSDRTFVVKDRTGSAGTNNITITTVGGSVTLDGATSFVMNTAYESVQLIFNGTSYEVY